MGKIPLEVLQLSWEKSQNMGSGERAEMLSTVDLHSCFLKVMKQAQVLDALFCFLDYRLQLILSEKNCHGKPFFSFVIWLPI